MVCLRAFPSFSQPMTVVLHKLSLDSCLGEWQKTWYNQMGGDKNCIKLVVNVLDAKGKSTKNAATSHYGWYYCTTMRSHRWCVHRCVLTISEDSQLSTEKVRQSLSATTEVSRRQNKPFKFRIEPDGTKDPLSMDVQSVVSPGVMVLSDHTKVKPTKTEGNTLTSSDPN